MAMTRITTIITNILLALLAIYSIVVGYNNWTSDTASNIGVIIAIALILGAAKVCQVFLLMIARGIDGIPMLFRKE